MFPSHNIAPSSHESTSLSQSARGTAVHDVPPRLWRSRAVRRENAAVTTVGNAEAVGPVRRVRRGGRRGQQAVVQNGGRNGAVAHQRAYTSSPYHYYPPRPLVVRPEVLYSRPPITARPGVVCNREQVDRCVDLLLELLGWGVPMEYLADTGFSLPGVIWLCAKLRLRLSWGIVIRAHEARIPFHQNSILPHGYNRYYYPL